MLYLWFRGYSSRHLTWRYPSSEEARKGNLKDLTVPPLAVLFQASPPAQVNQGLVTVFALCCVIAAGGFAWTWFIVDVSTTSLPAELRQLAAMRPGVESAI
jgi:hypothetical protein